MKKLNLYFGALVTIIFISCTGPQGPAGYDGFDGIDGAAGKDGINILGKVMDIEGSFTLTNNYAIFYEFPKL